MDRHYPTIYLYGDSEKSGGGPDEFKVRLSYGKERRETRIEESDWICPSVRKPSCRCSLLTPTVQHQQLCHSLAMFPLSVSEAR